MADVPHFDLPFRFNPTTATVEQDTVDDVVNCVATILRVHTEWRPEAPDFGFPDLAFRTQPIGTDQMRAFIVEQEPRAELIIQEYPDAFDELIVHFIVEVGARGGTF